MCSVLTVQLGCESSREVIDTHSLASLAADLPAIEGNDRYLASPFVTAGDRLYMVGHQDGRFPDLGWHVEGEMGGIWNHPIKLMDGFVGSIADSIDEASGCLESADRFLNYPLANKHVYERDDLTIERLQFVPDGIEGLVVEYAITNRSSERRRHTFTFTGMIDLMPVWLSERIGIEDGVDRASWDEGEQAMVAVDSLNSWSVVVGSSRSISDYRIGWSPCHQDRKGKGVDVSLAFDLDLGSGEATTIPFFVAGSYTSLDESLETFATLKTDAAQLLEEKLERYAAIKKTAGIAIPDKELQEVYTWIKYNADWLVRDVPEVGRGVSAGIPDYPWWFGADNTYTLQGVFATGQHDLARATMQLLHKLSEESNGNGRIVHEVSTNGVVFNPGNLNETPHFAMLVWNAFEWTGDREMLAQYYPTVKKGLDWMMTDQDEDGNGYPDGAGMMEIHGLDSEMIDVVVYTQQAFEVASRMAHVMDERDLATQYAHTARQLRDRINSEWWVDEASSYADFRATTRETLHLIEDAIVRADTLGKPWAIAELRDLRNRISGYPAEAKQGHVLHHNWVVNTPMEVGAADPDKALRALNTGARYTNPFGVYVTGIDRQEDQEEALESPNWQTFSYVGAVMTLPTGVQAIAEARYGRPDKAYEYLRMLTNSFSYALPGSMYEVSPDYGMIVQAWNVYAVAVPIVQYFFGVRPRAYDQHVTLRPRMPEGWDDALLANLPVGDNVITFEKQTAGGTVSYVIHQKESHWTVDLNLPRTDAIAVKVNGNRVEPEYAGDEMVIRLSGGHINVELAPS
ncbi:MAG: glycogen debranching protein [Rhodothermia bacterium]|nr:glycogen debranching protein [Rhodothermia bacterium]